MDKKDKKENPIEKFMLFAIFVLFLVLVKTQILDDGSSNEIADKKQLQDKVNFHLSHTQTLMDTRSGNSKLENFKLAPSLKDVKPEEVRISQDSELSVEGEESFGASAFDFEKRPSSRHGTSISDQINQDIIEKENIKREKELARQRYIEAFKENARRDGYELSVDSEGRVTNVKKIKEPQGESIWAPNEGFGSK